MQTIPVNSKAATKALHTLPASQISSPFLPGNFPPAAGEKRPAAATSEQAHLNPHAELDAMLIGDPNVGAMHGLRFALLFNAGVALSGLVIWELWSLLVP